MKIQHQHEVKLGRSHLALNVWRKCEPLFQTPRCREEYIQEKWWKEEGERKIVG